MSRKLLTESGLSIAELALIPGFANQSHFTAAFSKAMDMPPARYRQTSTA
ncbi:helix-turn-helix domain-containing protein [Sphingomonas sp. GlSt437]